MPVGPRPAWRALEPPHSRAGVGRGCRDAGAALPIWRAVACLALSHTHLIQVRTNSHLSRRLGGFGAAPITPDRGSPQPPHSQDVCLCPRHASDALRGPYTAGVTAGPTSAGTEPCNASKTLRHLVPLQTRVKAGVTTWEIDAHVGASPECLSVPLGIRRFQKHQGNAVLNPHMRWRPPATGQEGSGGRAPWAGGSGLQ